jgi:hypothetical protein
MDKFETQDIQLGHALTYKKFFEVFNEISEDYYACYNSLAGVLVKTRDSGCVMAGLDEDSCIWDFKESSFNFKELSLMAKLASVPPKFRGEI